MGALSTHRMPRVGPGGAIFRHCSERERCAAQNTTDTRIPVTGLPYSNGDGMDTHTVPAGHRLEGVLLGQRLDILGANRLQFRIGPRLRRNIMRLNEDRVACGNAGQPACPPNGPGHFSGCRR
jgi:hypothetical protein